MSKWPMRGHFRYLRFKTFQMTLRTLKCEVFWALLSSSNHSGVPEGSKTPTLEVLGFTPTLGQSGVATTTKHGIFHSPPSMGSFVHHQAWDPPSPPFSFSLKGGLGWSGALSLSCLGDNFHASLNTGSASFSRKQIMMSLRRGEKEIK